jgi:hypothetical protein
MTEPEIQVVFYVSAMHKIILLLNSVASVQQRKPVNDCCYSKLHIVVLQCSESMLTRELLS